MNVPKSLKKGDTVGLVSVSGAISKEVLSHAVQSVEQQGFQVYVGETLKAKNGYFAGPDDLRAKELMELFLNPDIDGIFCVKGGYGALRVLPLLNYEAIQRNPKVFTGYSDVTALHIAINQKCGFVTYHTPMPATEFIQEAMDTYTWNSFLTAVSNPKSYVLQNPPHQPILSFVGGRARGRLIGGNLSLIVSTLGTSYEIDTDEKILFLEDIDESPLKIDRMLTQLKLAKKFENVKGILLGSWKNCHGNEKGNNITLSEIFVNLFSPLKVPVLWNLACGHCLPTMSLPLGRIVEIDADKKIITVVE